jgi:predicted adenine nucleotide alpha hydrolase (AANH) superfamily ATPase
VKEEIRLIEAYNQQVKNGNFQNMNSTENAGFIEICEAEYNPSKFYEAIKGFENLGEGSERCKKCFELRLRESAKVAKEGGFDYFTTTLTISPLKDAQKINEIGNELAKEYGIEWLPSDFKKREGYKRSIELSKVFNLYRQNYCGCVHSQNEQ